MLLGFKRRFADFVEEGSKTHTIRKARVVAPRAGEICHCYVDPRQKTMRLLGRFPCVRVQEIEINWLAVKRRMSLIITIEGVDLSPDEANLLAYRDGFRTYGHEAGIALGEMQDYWHTLHGANAFPFVGHLINWEFRR